MVRTSDVAIWLKLVVLSLAGFLFACGGGGGGTPASTDTTITGSVVAAPVSGASVVVKDTGGNTIAGPVKTGSDATYRIDVPNDALSGELVFESTGGTFKDEATTIQGTAGLLAAYAASGSLSSASGVHLTPASTIVQDLMRNHGKTHVEAQALIKNAFGFEVDTAIAPVDVTNPPAGAGQERILAGLRAAVFSQLTNDLGLTVGAATEQFDLLPALARDIADGTFDGEDTGGVVAITNAINLPADVQNRFSHALAFMHGETKGKTGLTDDQIGSLPFAKLAMTNSYKIEYLPGMMPTMAGKTMFQLRITDHSGTTPLATGTAVTLMPMMHMAMHMHSTPVSGCEETATAGTYDCTVYYLMASSMMSGESMGYWELKVMIGGMMGESATFYPQVMMAMGNTPRVILKGQADKIMGMAMGGMPATEENRSYYLFNDGLSGMGDNRTFDLFIAAKESMKSYPALAEGMTLRGDMDPDVHAHDLNVVAVTVEVSTDATTWDAVTVINNGNGHWSATGITGLVNGEASMICARLTIHNGVADERKTTNGDLENGPNGYSCFTVTPGSMMSGM